jgi:hypothetical protein
MYSMYVQTMAAPTAAGLYACSDGGQGQALQLQSLVHDRPRQKRLAMLSVVHCRSFVAMSILHNAVP